MKYPGFLVLTLCALFVSCKSTKVVTPEEFEGNRLILSHGGGFTGKYKTYCLLENGQLFKNSTGFEATELMSPLDKKIADQIFSNYEVLGLGNEKVVSYDNLNYSIILINDQGEEHNLIWGKGQKGTDKLQLFYNNVMTHIKMVIEKERQIQKTL